VRIFESFNNTYLWTFSQWIRDSSDFLYTTDEFTLKSNSFSILNKLLPLDKKFHHISKDHETKYIYSDFINSKSNVLSHDLEIKDLNQFSLNVEESITYLVNNDLVKVVYETLYNSIDESNVHMGLSKLKEERQKAINDHTY
jgi:hypothetical protein